MGWIKENRLLLSCLLLLLLLNIAVYFKYFSELRPDLKVSNVSWREEQNSWVIEVSSNLPIPDEQAEVVTVFSDGRVEKELWPLEATTLRWEYKVSAPLESVVIYAPPEVDWDQTNSIYFSDLWSREVKLSLIPAKGEYALAIDQAKQNLYLFHTEGFIRGKPQPGITLVGFDITGKQVFAPKNFAETNRSDIRYSHPMLTLSASEGQDLKLMLGWNQLTADGDHAQLYHGRLSRTENGHYELTGLEKSNIEGRIYDSLLDQPAGGSYLLTGIDRTISMEWVIYRIDQQGLRPETVIPIVNTTLEQIEISQLINDGSFRYLFWLEKKEGTSIVKYMVTSSTGEVLIPAKEIGRARVDYAIPEPFQVLRAGQRFHLVWVEKAGSFAPAHSFNYLIIDVDGNQVIQRNDFVEAKKYTQGFDMMLDPGGNIEFVFTKYHGHKTFQPQRNTDIHYVKYRTEDLQPITPIQTLVRSSYYERNPQLFYLAGNNRLLSWTRSKKEGEELYYFTTDPELRKILAEGKIGQFLKLIYHQSQDYIYSLMTGLIIVVILSMLPLLGLFVYNLLGKYKKGLYLYWVGAVLTIFPLKLLTETLFIPLDHPGINRIFRLNLAFGLVILLLAGVYWYISKNGKGGGRTEGLNRILVCWVIIESFVIYLSFIQDVFIT